MKFKEITLNKFGVNDETATLIDWLYKDCDYININDTIAIAESTKSSFDIIGNESGYLVHLKEIGDELSLNKPIAIIVESKEDIEKIKQKYINTQQYSITKKAQLLIDKYNIDINSIEKSGGIIREKDIQSIIKKNIIPPINNYPNEGKVEKDFLIGIANDKSFLNLNSEDKITEYRKNGAVIEDGVIIGENSIIISDHIVLREYSIIKENCYIKSEYFILGIMSVIGHSANIVTRKVKIGDVFFSGNSVRIGGGSSFSHKAELIIGNECLISSNCFLNTGEGIYIGNRVGLSPHVKLYTHSHWQNELDGYHSNFGPITIEDNVYITGDSIIIPNVNIGKGSTVLANSTVVNNVEEYTQVCGNPAVFIKKINTKIDQGKKNYIINKIINEIINTRQIYNIEKNDIVYREQIYNFDNINEDIIICCYLDENLRIPDGKVIFNINNYQINGTQNKKSDEVRNFLRKRGIRFSPIYWRYNADKGLYND